MTIVKLGQPKVDTQQNLKKVQQAERIITSVIRSG